VPRFLLVGGLTAGCDFGLLALLHGGLGLALAPATAIAFCAAFLVNFTLSRHWTFQQGRAGSTRGQLSRFAALAGINLIVTVLLVTGLAALSINYLIAKAMTAALVAFCNFFAYRRWVFV
jgi:putative flippase GtrA